MIDFSISKEQKELVDEIVDFAQNTLCKNVESRDEAQRFDLALWNECGRLKLQGLSVAKKYGGRGLDAVSTCLALEALGYGSNDGGLNFCIAAHNLACVVPIYLYGTEDQKQKFLPDLCSGKSIAGNAMTEASAGSDAFTMESHAALTANGYLINGTKTYVSNGPVSDIALFYAVTDKEKGFFGGISGFILEHHKGHYQRGEAQDKLGLRTCQMGQVVCDNSVIPQENILGKAGGGAMIFTKSMVWERTCLGALHLGTVKRLLENAIKFVNHRISGNQSLGKYQAISSMIAQIQVELEAARALTLKAAWSLDKGKDLYLMSSATKLFTSEFYQDSMSKIMQIYGGYSFLGNTEVERNLRDSTAATIYSGTSEIQRNLISAHLGL